MLLPLVALLILAVLQAALIGRAQIELQSAVREAARICAVNPSCSADQVVSAHTDLPVTVNSSLGTDVVVDATAEVPVVLPGLRDWRSITVQSRAVMRIETG